METTWAWSETKGCCLLLLAGWLAGDGSCRNCNFTMTRRNTCFAVTDYPKVRQLITGVLLSHI